MDSSKATSFSLLFKKKAVAINMPVDDL